MTEAKPRQYYKTSKKYRDHEIKMKILDLMKEDKQIKWMLLMLGSAGASQIAKLLEDKPDDSGFDTSASGLLKILSPWYALTPDWASPAKAWINTNIGDSTPSNPWEFMTMAAKSLDNLQVFAAMMLVLSAVFGGNDKEGISSMVGALI